MTSLTKRASILIFCRVANLLVMVLSPILLVRIFDVRSYGQYREFMLYAVLLSGLMEFAINKNPIYFIAKYPDRERQSISHTALLMLIASSIGLAIVYLSRGLIFARTSFDFIPRLLLFLFFFLNLDFLESYLLGKKRADLVLIYSSSRIAVRTIALIVVAYASRSVVAVIDVLIAVEAAKCLAVLWITRKILTRHLDRQLLREQLGFILPLGVSAGISAANSQLANLVISVKMGVERLALYSIGSQQVPILDIVQASIMDVLFPEMTQRQGDERLDLWRHANVVLCFIAFPVYAVFFFFAPTYIGTLFTEAYLGAVPLFRIYLTLLILQCFEMNTPLRSMNKNRYFIVAGLASFAVNIGFIVALLQYIGFVTPAIARVLGTIVMAVYCAAKILQLYGVRLSNLCLWRKVATVALCAVTALPALIVSVWIPINPVAKALSFSVLYLAVYYLLARRFGIEEVEILSGKVISRIRSVLARN